MPKRIGIVLRDARQAAGLTQTAVSRRAGLAAGQLSQIESGRSSSPEFATVARVASVVGASLDSIAAACGMMPVRKGKRELDGLLRRLTVAEGNLEKAISHQQRATDETQKALSEVQDEVRAISPPRRKRRRTE